MKVTTLLPDKLIAEVRELSHGKNITESLKIALNDWIKIQRLRALNSEIKRNPVSFEYAAEEIRTLNRK